MPPKRTASYFRKALAKSAKASKKKSQRTPKKLSVSAVKKIAASVMLRKSEQKHINYNHGKIELYHNTGSPTFKSLNASDTMPTQGVGDNQRIGDRITAQKLQLRLLCGQKYDRPNVTWRVIVFSVKSGQAPINGLGINQFFEQTTGNILLDNINTDLARVHYQKYFKPLKSSLMALDASGVNGNDVTKEYTFAKKININFKNKTIVFQSNGGVVTNERDYYIYVGVYDAFGTLVTDNIGYYQMWSQLKFKDL